MSEKVKKKKKKKKKTHKKTSSPSSQAPKETKSGTIDLRSKKKKVGNWLIHTRAKTGSEKQKKEDQLLFRVGWVQTQRSGPSASAIDNPADPSPMICDQCPFGLRVQTDLISDGE